MKERMMSNTNIKKRAAAEHNRLFREKEEEAKNRLKSKKYSQHQEDKLAAMMKGALSRGLV